MNHASDAHFRYETLRARRRAAAPMIVALVAIGALALLLAGGVDLRAWFWLLGLAALAAAAVAYLSLRETPQESVEALGLYALCEAGPEAFLLTQQDGEVIAANRRARALPAPAPEHVSAILGANFEQGESLAYRMLRAALAGEPAVEPAEGPDGWVRVSARLISRGLVLWAIWPEQADGPMRAAVAAQHMECDALLEALPVAVARAEASGRILALNAAARALLGPEARPGARLQDLVEGLGQSMEERVAEAARGVSTGRHQVARMRRGGRETFLQIALSRLTQDGVASLAVVLADATELKTLEAQFVQSQKMQAVGQLAGGVAHDFNNLLTAISGHADLLLHRRGPSDPDYADLNQIRQNVNRAAGLVRQLLAFSRKQTLRPTVVQLAESLDEVSHLLNRLLGEKVTLRIEHAPRLHAVKVDERQFEQVIMNLVVNARDAMPHGGTVTLRTANERLETERRIGRAVMPRGDYVRIDVVDEGTGIPPEKLDQIFEPFFTTKRQGEGTGLGLSTVYGIIKQTGGYVFVESRVGVGSTFTIYLPRHAEEQAAPEPAARAEAVGEDLTGAGSVLLIEDEAPVRAFAARALRLRGYEVAEAASAEDALELLDDDGMTVDVIVSDVVMPGMDGPTCVRAARKSRPGVAVVFMSGYAEDSLKRNMEDIEGCWFLSKPFSLNDLTLKVKEALAGRK